MFVGITGGIACGKSSVAGFIRGKGYSVILTDQIGHGLLLKTSVCASKIIERFGVEIIDNNGNISREKLSRQVFGDSEKRGVLNGILHPEIRRIWKTQAAEFVGKNPGQTVFVEIPLLFETHAEGEFDMIVSVVCSPEIQVGRLVNERKLSRNEALLRIDAQIPMAVKAEKSDFIIWNNFTTGHRDRQTCILLEKLNLSDR